MTRFLTQVMLSVIVTLGLVAGFNPELKLKAKQTLGETKALVMQVAKYTTHNLAGNLDSKLKSDISAEAKASNISKKSDTELETEGEVKAKTKGGLDLSKFFDDFIEADTNVGAEAKVEPQVEASANGDDFDLDLSNDAESDFGLDLDFGR